MHEFGLQQHVPNGAEVLFVCINRDATNPDPVKDQRGCYKRGDVQDVLPGTAHDGDLQANPIADPWWMIRVVGIPREVAAKYLDPGTDAQGVANRRRLYGIVAALLPVTVQLSLTTDRYAVIQWSVLRLAMRNKVTLATEP